MHAAWKRQNTRFGSNLYPDVSEKLVESQRFEEYANIPINAAGHIFYRKNFFQKYTILHVKVYALALVGADVCRIKAPLQPCGGKFAEFTLRYFPLRFCDACS
jgi:hypothetical protein